ncbi:SPOSA6832_04244 [Sporobolomyces salmonicolor]|uniref:SPOSA6832_04244-mRNA-1:cds n=1 Tax=Sporidiobolus salmonicolor TaxID=5005 RepID=A0A0D6ES75_SPOSA|nr:SPOSA6832_04244 [Sporobolomyces salmonicolor]
MRSFPPLSQDYISYLSSKLSPATLEQQNAKLSIIGCGDWELIQPYKELLGVPWEFYADPGKKSYEALGMTLRTLDMGKEAPEYMKKGMLGNIFSSILLRLPKDTRKQGAFKMGGIGRRNAGDIKQLGGEFVFDSNNVAVYTHRMENTRGHAPLAELFSAIGLPYDASTAGGAGAA